MKFKDFQKSTYAKAYGAEVVNQIQCYDSTIVEASDGNVYVDGVRSDYVSLEEAKSNIEQKRVHEDIQRQIQQDLYEEMSPSVVSQIIKKYHDVKVTDTLIESYVELASSKLFTTDSVSHEIRQHTRVDRLLEGHFDYVLNDGTVMVITEGAQQRINNTFGNHPDVIEYMRESKENFLDVLNQVEE
jgi:hypothetical protein